MQSISRNFKLKLEHWRKFGILKNLNHLKISIPSSCRSISWYFYLRPRRSLHCDRFVEDGIFLNDNAEYLSRGSLSVVLRSSNQYQLAVPDLMEMFVDIAASKNSEPFK